MFLPGIRIVTGLALCYKLFTSYLLKVLGSPGRADLSLLNLRDLYRGLQILRGLVLDRWILHVLSPDHRILLHGLQNLVRSFGLQPAEGWGASRSRPVETNKIIVVREL